MLAAAPAMCRLGAALLSKRCLKRSVRIVKFVDSCAKATR